MPEGSKLRRKIHTRLPFSSTFLHCFKFKIIEMIKITEGSYVLKWVLSNPEWGQDTWGGVSVWPEFLSFTDSVSATCDFTQSHHEASLSLCLWGSCSARRLSERVWTATTLHTTDSCPDALCCTGESSVCPQVGWCTGHKGHKGQEGLAKDEVISAPV